MSAGEAGQVVISGATRDALQGTGTEAQATPLGRVTVKGKSRPVEAFVLETLEGTDSQPS
jgi:class 3 adenylate cyclase